MVEAVFFDLWNTILYCPTRNKVEDMIGILGLSDRIGYQDVIEWMKKTIFVDESYRVEDILVELCSEHDCKSTKKEIYEAGGVWRSRLDETRYFPETQQVLSDLKRDYKTAVISNVDASGAEYARRMFLKQYFDYLVMSCEVGMVKPDPGIYRICLDRLGLQANDCWMVGDNLEADVYGAQIAGLNAILIDRNGYNEKADCAVIKDLAEIRGIIE